MSPPAFSKKEGQAESRKRKATARVRRKGEAPDGRGGVAQLGEHLLCKQGVIGSNPFISTKKLEAGYQRLRVERQILVSGIWILKGFREPVRQTGRRE